MIKPMLIAMIILVAAALPALAQGAAAQDAQPPATAVGPTGTMYDGNNADLRLPPEQNAYWARLWAQPGAPGNPGAATAPGAGAAGTSPGGTTPTGRGH